MTPKQKDQAWVESQRADNAKAAKLHRDAITGQYVDEDHVKANPDTTVTETIRARSKVVLECDTNLSVDQRSKLSEYLGTAFPDGFVLLPPGVRSHDPDHMAELIAAINANTEVQRGILAVLIEDAAAAAEEEEPEEPASPYL